MDYHNGLQMQNEQVLDEDIELNNVVTPEKNEFSSVDSRITVVRYPGQVESSQSIDVDLVDEDSPFKLRLFPVQIFD